MNWVDLLILLTICISVYSGLSQGFVKIGIGFVSMICGFLFATWFYGMVGGQLIGLIGSRALANIAGFILIYVGILALGALVGIALSRILKVVGLSWADRLLGGAFGLVRGMVFVAVFLWIVTALAPLAPKALVGSQAAPYALRVGKFLSAVAPYELKNGFERSYRELTSLWRPSPEKRLKTRED